MAQTGISKSKLDSLCLEIQNYAERMQNILNQLDVVMDHSKVAFGGEVSLDFYTKYGSLSACYKVINENLLSYIDDFRIVASRFEQQDTLLAKEIDQKRVEYLEERSDMNASN